MKHHSKEFYEQNESLNAKREGYMPQIDFCDFQF